MNKFSLFDEVIEEKQQYTNPLNIKNVCLNKKIIQNILRKYNVKYEIQDLKLYQKAFIHKSYTIKANEENDITEEDEMPLQKESNERLEFLGDSIIGLIVTSYLFRRYTGQNEGFMTKLKTKLVNTYALSRFARILNLGQYLVISIHVEEKCNGRNNDKLLEDLFEAFIGALYLDANNINLNLDKNLLRKFNFNKRSGFGYQICEKFLLNLIEEEVDFEDLILNDDNYKDKLLQYYQHNFQITPKYKLLGIENGLEGRIFKIGVLDKDGIIISTGIAKSKKKAEQLASKNALLKLNI